MSGFNRHRFIDTTAIGVGSLFIPKYFRDGVESPSVEEHIAGVQLDVPQFENEKTCEVAVETLAGPLTAAVQLAQWKGSGFPTIIYHHGALEIPYDYGFRRIFPLGKHAIDANLFLIRAPFHDRRKHFIEGMATTRNWLTMMAVSVNTIQQVIQQVRVKSDKKILVGGTSLGGFVTNLHHIHFNSADVYTPLLAGLAMDDVLLHSVYSKSVAASAKAQPEIMRRLFNFQPDFQRSGQSHECVHPLLAEHDAIIRFDVQRESYGGMEVAIIEKGHTTGAMDYLSLRNHMMDKLAAIQGIIGE